jgi:hypothetical protein
VPAQRDGQGQRLDGECGGDAAVGKRLADRLGDAQIGKKWARVRRASGYVIAVQGLGSMRLRCQSSASLSDQGGRLPPHLPLVGETRQQASRIPLVAAGKSINEL